MLSINFYQCRQNNSIQKEKYFNKLYSNVYIKLQKLMKLAVLLLNTHEY